MKVGWKTRILLFMLCFVWPVSFLFASYDTYIEVIRLDNGQNLTGVRLNTTAYGIEIHLKTYQTVAFKFTAAFQNSSITKDYRGFMFFDSKAVPYDARDTDLKTGTYIEGFVDSSMVVPVLETTRIPRYVYLISPQYAGTDSFSVSSLLRKSNDPNDPDWGNGAGSQFKVIIHVSDIDTNVIQPPRLCDDSIHFSSDPADRKYTQGLTNSILWWPGQGDSTVRRIDQDVYVFEQTNRENLRKSIQGMYRHVSIDSPIVAFFDNLVDGHLYGYFAKAIYTISENEVTLCTPILYSIQDHSPPHRITDCRAGSNGDGGKILVWWRTVIDDISGIAVYRVYRASDTGYESLLMECIPSDTPVDSMVFADRIDSGATYYYRVRAVDRVGNEGDGVRSNGVLWESASGDSGAEPESDADDEEGNTSGNTDGIAYSRGPVDTIRIQLKGWEKQIRFLAVRQDSSYFNDPPDVGARYFDSGWITPRSFWIFDYSYNTTRRVAIDPNFVDNRLYYRRIMRKTISDTVYTESLDPVIMDCFPPEDVDDFQAEAVVQDPHPNPPMGYNHWLLELTWNTVEDGASGLKRYHLYRRVYGIQSNYEEINLPNDFQETSYIDSLSEFGGGVTNHEISYKVVAEDRVGNIRSLNNTQSEVRERGLGAPMIEFLDFPELDTSFTYSQSVPIHIKDPFNLSAVDSFAVSVNGIETTLPPSAILSVTLSMETISRIKIRAIALGKRSSVWSNLKVISLTNQVPMILDVVNDSAFWEGNLYLVWRRSSLDTKKYEVWRRPSGGVWGAINTSVVSKEDTVRWTDYYGMDEMSGEPGDTLTTYRWYEYKIRMINVYDSISPFSNSMVQYCNRPVTVDSNSMQIGNGQPDIHIFWKRSPRNDVKNNFTSLVRTYRNSLTNFVREDTITNDKTEYTFRHIEIDNNYIFQIMEFPNQLHDMRTAWSQPYTVSLRKMDMITLSQPTGPIFVEWDSSIVNTHKVAGFVLKRMHENRMDTTWIMDTTWYFPNIVFSTMDISQTLIHGERYRYAIFALDSLDQMIATNSSIDTCDNGAVFIPTIQDFPNDYFHSDSILVFWEWRGINPDSVVDWTRGAVKAYLEASVSSLFPNFADQTTREGPFPCNATNRCRKMAVPSLLNRDNNVLYFRITAWDAWGHPADTLWSTDFYPMMSVLYDPISPFEIPTFSPVSSVTFYHGPDSIVVSMEWSDQSLLDSDHLIGNVAQYEIIHTFDSVEETVGTVSVDPGGITNYSIMDTVTNRPYMWKIISIDSAGNRYENPWIPAPVFVSTPNPPVPTGYRSCSFEVASPDTFDLDYFVEIAANPDHFWMAYEMDAIMLDRLLYRSGWIDATSDSCSSGWGSIVMDSTWFRLKVRTLGVWESGWSVHSYFTDAGNGSSKNPSSESSSEIPVSFAVHPNYPNPFNASTVIAYDLPRAASVDIRIYNIQGMEVRRWTLDHSIGGFYSMVWDGTDRDGSGTASGIYLAMVQVVDEKNETYRSRLKMMLIR